MQAPAARYVMRTEKENSVGSRIAILGSGANGAALGADMINAGRDVTFIEQWPEHVEAMRRNGLRVTDAATGDVIVTPVTAHHLCEVAELRAQFDLVYMVLKAYDTRWGAELIKPLLAPDGVVINLQNGMSLDDLESILGPEKTLGGVIEMGSNLRGPGDVERHVPVSKSWFAVGSQDPNAAAKAKDAAAALRAAGTVAVIPEIRQAKWMKLVLNASQLVPSGVLDMSIVDAAQDPSTRELMFDAGMEALAAAAERSIPITPIMGLSDVDPNDPEQFMNDIFELLLNGFALPTTKATMLYDWNHGRRSEVDQINGLVVDVLGAARAPVNAAATEIAHRIESGDLMPGPHNLATFRALAGR